MINNIELKEKEIDNLKDKEIDDLKDKEISELNKKVDELKIDIKICLQQNDLYNVEIRQIKLYNYLFQITGAILISSKIYYYYKK